MCFLKDFDKFSELCFFVNIVVEILMKFMVIEFSRSTVIGFSRFTGLSLSGFMVIGFSRFTIIL